MGFKKKIPALKRHTGEEESTETTKAELSEMQAEPEDATPWNKGCRADAGGGGGQRQVLVLV